MRIGQRRSRIRIYAPKEEATELRSTRTTWTPLAYEWGGFVPSYLTLRSYGAGEVPSGTREIELGSYSSIDERCGLKVVDGPEAGTKWRAVSVDSSDPRKTLVRVEPYTGEFE